MLERTFEKYNITKCRPSLVKDEFFYFLYTVLRAYEFENCIEKQFKAAIVSKKRLIINKCRFARKIKEIIKLKSIVYM